MSDAPVVEHTSRGALLNPAAMETGRIYTVLLGGQWLAVTKEPDGSLSFYATEAP